MWNPVRKLVEDVGETNPLVLAHHPTCEFYDHHTVTIYGQKICMGCVIVYPTAFISLLVLSTLWFLWPDLGVFARPTKAFYVGGFGLIGPMIVTKLLPGIQSSTVRITAKFALAVGLAIVAFPFIFRPPDRLLTLGLFVGFLIPYVIQKGVTARDDCQGCPEAAEFPNCSGMTFGEESTHESDRLE